MHDTENALLVTKSKLEQHTRVLTRSISDLTLSQAPVLVTPDWGVTPLVMGIVGQDCEIAARQRGKSARVARLCEIGPDGLCAWLGLREEWDVVVRGRGVRYCFRYVSLTIHAGYPYREEKPQIFRAEWVGSGQHRESQFDAVGNGAGHPHWQFDAIDSLSHSNALGRDPVTVPRLDDAENVKPRDFVGRDMGRARVQTLKLSRIHFASAAAWWQTATDNHIHSPDSIQDVERWIQNTVEYTRAELMRLA